MRLGIIGVGHLASAIIVRLLETGWPAEKLVLSPRGKSAELAALYPLNIAPDTARLVETCDAVLLAVRPADAVTAITGLPWNKDQILISACAGVRIKALQPAAAPASIARIMPLTAATLGASPTTLYPDIAAVRPLLERLGRVLPLRSEAEFEVATVTAAMYGWAQELVRLTSNWLTMQGLEPATARQLTARTFTAAGRITAEAPESIEDLMHSLVTPGGITELGLKTLSDHGAPEAWRQACEAVLARLQAGRRD